jgi:hypothetical protein
MKLGDLCEVKINFPDADFWIQRRGTPENVGRVKTEFNKEDIGIKVKDPTVLLPRFLQYAMMNIYNKGYYRDKMQGMTALQHIRSSDIKEIPVG